MLLVLAGAAPIDAQEPPKNSEATLQIYPVPDGAADAVAKLLQEAYPPPQTRITPSGKDRIVVFANEKTHVELAKQRLLTLPTTAMDVVPLGAHDAVTMAAALQKIMGAAVGKRLVIVAEPDKNSIILRGDADLIVEAKKLLALLGNEPNREGVRVLRVEKAGAATVADALYQLLAKLRPDNDIHLVLPGSPEPVEQKKKEPAKKDARSAKKREPVTITAFGDRLMITTADREVMDLIIHVTRILITTETGGCDFEIIRFKHAKATHVAQILDEAFNHPTSPNYRGFRIGGGFGGGGGGRVPSGSGEDGSTKNERIRVIADPATNTLLLRATPLDATAIRRLITEALDTPDAAEKRGLKDERKKD
jgi:type II secretory pathway component GspD/PulD (secretin)